MTDLQPAAAPTVLATPDQLDAFTNEWLNNRRLTSNTRDAYRRDIKTYLDWCRNRPGGELAPLAARFTHINDYGRHLEATLSPRSVARKMSAVSSWYAFLLKLGAVPANPADGTDRPVIDRDDTTTIGFTEAEAAAIVAAARDDRHLGTLCATALAETMVALGARVTELCLTAIGDLGHGSGHRTLRLERMKAGRKRTRSLPPAAAAAIEAMLAARADRDDDQAPLFVDMHGRPVDRHAVYRFVRRAARAAGVPAAGQITPHSFRHAWATAAKQAGAALEDRQHALGHKDPRTTQGYDRARESLDRDPSYLVAAAVAAARAE